MSAVAFSRVSSHLTGIRKGFVVVFSLALSSPSLPSALVWPPPAPSTSFCAFLFSSLFSMTSPTSTPSTSIAVASSSPSLPAAVFTASISPPSALLSSPKPAPATFFVRSCNLTSASPIASFWSTITFICAPTPFSPRSYSSVSTNECTSGKAGKNSGIFVARLTCRPATSRAAPISPNVCPRLSVLCTGNSLTPWAKSTSGALCLYCSSSCSLTPCTSRASTTSTGLILVRRATSALSLLCLESSRMYLISMSSSTSRHDAWTESTPFAFKSSAATIRATCRG
mmetsp:Transcript_12213/g.34703  ORF Transcript_12213/g.34703 Transcript_12213/m.34703 type:complete len:284 (+) Transcript_12213:375-1226(+)